SYAFCLSISLFILCFNFLFFFFNHTPTTDIYTLSLHDALPIYYTVRRLHVDLLALQSGIAVEFALDIAADLCVIRSLVAAISKRSEEHTSELQSRGHLVCRLLLEKKKKYKINTRRI